MNEAGTTKYVNNASAIQLKPRIKKNIDTTVFAVLINSKDFTFCFGHSCLSTNLVELLQYERVQ